MKRNGDVLWGSLEKGLLSGRMGVGLLIVWGFVLAGAETQAGQANLLDDFAAWSANADGAGPTVSLAKAEGGLAVTVNSDGGGEKFPKAHRAYADPQDWRGFSRLNMRLRVVCDDPKVHHKSISLVFYDDKTRLPDVAGSPMKQQCVFHSIPVNRWVEMSEWLTGIQRSAIRQLDLYLYEVAPGKPHEYRWEVAKLEFEEIKGESVAWDTTILGRSEIRGDAGSRVGMVATQDGLELGIGSAGEVARLSVGEKAVGVASKECPSGLLVRDAAKKTPPAMVGGAVRCDGKQIKQTSSLDDLGLKVDATYTAQPDYIEVAGTIADTRGEDRAVTVYLALPVVAGPWQWWDSAAAHRTAVDASKELFCYETGTSYGMNGCHSKYPLGTITLPDTAGVSLAIRMDEPVVHRIVYHPGLRLFFMAMDFGLATGHRLDGSALSETPFRFLVYRSDAAWGLRSSLDRYYGFFPEFFTKRTTKEGGWFVWGDMSKTPGAVEAGLGMHWGPAGAEAVKWDNAHGPLALFYIEPQTYQQTMEDFDKAPSVDDVTTRLGKLVDGDAEELAKVAGQPYRVYPIKSGAESLADRIRITALAVAKSLNQDIAGEPYCTIGQFEWMSKSKWGAILGCNLAPGIPGGKGQFNLEQIVPPALRDMDAAGGRYDGIGLDSFGGYGEHGAVNFRRENFRYSKMPLCFSSLDHRPVQVNAFTTVEWLRVLAKQIHADGKVLMANCSWSYTPGWLTFAAPYLDVFGAEAPSFVDPDFIRAIAYRKVCTDLPYTPRPAWEVPLHWLHAIYPGHGNDLKAMEACNGLLRELVAVGWEPVTGAHATPDGIRVERYGAKDRIYLVLHNPKDQLVSGEVQLDRAVLGEASRVATLQPAGKEAPMKNGVIPVLLEPKQTAILVLRQP